MVTSKSINTNRPHHIFPQINLKFQGACSNINNVIQVQSRRGQNSPPPPPPPPSSRFRQGKKKNMKSATSQSELEEKSYKPCQHENRKSVKQSFVLEIFRNTLRGIPLSFLIFNGITGNHCTICFHALVICSFIFVT